VASRKTRTRCSLVSESPDRYDHERNPIKGRRSIDRNVGHRTYGRRLTDEPQPTMSKKFVVVAVALINFAYLAGNTFLSITHMCGG